MYPYRNDNRFIFPFAGPFLLGALTGGVAASAFNPGRPRPMRPRPMPYYPGGGYYGSYYGGYNPF